MTGFSINDPKNKISLKVNVKSFDDGDIMVLFEILKLEENNRTLASKVEFFMTVSDFDYISYLYEHYEILDEGLHIIKGKNGKARGISFKVDYKKISPGHLTITVANGKGATSNNGFTKLETVESKLLINISREQSIKLLKSIEREILISSL